MLHASRSYGFSSNFFSAFFTFSGMYSVAACKTTKGAGQWHHQQSHMVLTRGTWRPIKCYFVLDVKTKEPFAEHARVINICRHDNTMKRLWPPSITRASKYTLLAVALSTGWLVPLAWSKFVLRRNVELKVHRRYIMNSFSLTIKWSLSRQQARIMLRLAYQHGVGKATCTFQWQLRLGKWWKRTCRNTYIYKFYYFACNAVNARSKRPKADWYFSHS